MSELFGAMTISAHGMKAQGTRIRVISQNMANANTAAETPDGEPYRRKNVIFKNVMDREMGMETIQVDKIKKDYQSEFTTKYMPDHPAANEQGYVKMPNIKPLVEMNDMREAQRSYEANLGMIEQSRNMVLQTIDLLRR